MQRMQFTHIAAKEGAQKSHQMLICCQFLPSNAKYFQTLN